MENELPRNDESHISDELLKVPLKLIIQVFNNISEGISLTDEYNKIVYVNPAFTQITGYTEEEVLGKNPSILSSRLQSNALYTDMWTDIHEKGMWRGKITNRHKEGAVYPETLIVLAVKDELGNINNHAGIFSDLTERIRNEGNQRLYARVFDSSSEGIVIMDTQEVILAVNPAFTTITGYSEDESIGQPARILHLGIHDEQLYNSMWSIIHNQGNWKGEIWTKRNHGQVYPAWLSIDSVMDDQGHIIQYVGMLTDITDRKKAEDQLKYLAYTDVLTGLPNRFMYYDRLDHALTRAKLMKEMIALIFLDLNRFKVINDTLGHSIGDQLLIQVADRLKKSLRQCDTIARLGGDEFTIVLTDTPNRRDIMTVVYKLIECFNKPFIVNKNELFISGSVGISIYPEDGGDIETLIKNADTAMYRAKESKADYQFYSVEIDELNTNRMNMEISLRKALKNKELLMYYQPQVDTYTREIVGLEALLRWNHPEEGMISPADFIPIAEETGLIIAIGEWVIENVCQQISLWKQKGYMPIDISINLSPLQLMDNIFLTKLNSMVMNSSIDPEYLSIEITESISTHNHAGAQKILNEIKKLGVSISIDDFGTGHSSYAYLKRYQPNTMKIDQLFIRNIQSDKHNAAIVKSIIELARGLDIIVIAEGVETEEELEILKQFRCDHIQGYLISKPIHPKDIERFLLRSDIIS
jgi:diguanylate cyclase (GGDEF)-like protein/PAS domain S-box-containing protein